VSVVADAALRAVGTRFRLHGRGADGLDCVGLVALALRAGGYAGAVPTGYCLRGGDWGGSTGCWCESEPRRPATCC